MTVRSDCEKWVGTDDWVNGSGTDAYDCEE